MRCRALFPPFRPLGDCFTLRTGFSDRYPTFYAGGILHSGLSQNSRLCQLGKDPVGSSRIPTCPFPGGKKGSLYVTHIAVSRDPEKMNNRDLWCRISAEGGCRHLWAYIAGVLGPGVVTLPPYRAECYNLLPIPSPIPITTANTCIVCVAK